MGEKDTAVDGEAAADEGAMTSTQAEGGSGEQSAVDGGADSSKIETHETKDGGNDSNDAENNDVTKKGESAELDTTSPSPESPETTAGQDKAASSSSTTNATAATTTDNHDKKSTEREVAKTEETSTEDDPAQSSSSPKRETSSGGIAAIVSSNKKSRPPYRYDPDKITLRFLFANRDGLTVTVECRPNDTVGEVKGALLSVWPEDLPDCAGGDRLRLVCMGKGLLMPDSRTLEDCQVPVFKTHPTPVNVSVKPDLTQVEASKTGQDGGTGGASNTSDGAPQSSQGCACTIL